MESLYKMIDDPNGCPMRGFLSLSNIISIMIYHTGVRDAKAKSNLCLGFVFD